MFYFIYVVFWIFRDQIRWFIWSTTRTKKENRIRTEWLEGMLISERQQNIYQHFRHWQLWTIWQMITETGDWWDQWTEQNEKQLQQIQEYHNPIESTSKYEYK